MAKKIRLFFDKKAFLKVKNVASPEKYENNRAANSSFIRKIRMDIVKMLRNLAGLSL